MFHLMNPEQKKSDSKCRKLAPVKREVEDDALPDEQINLNKRSKLSSPLQKNLGDGSCSITPSQYNPLDEPSPLGLRLRKSPSLLELIQMRLAQGNGNKVGSLEKDHKSAASGASEKLKASNFPGSLLKIGSWEYKSKHEGDLVAKCYFAKHKLVWEVLDGGLKNKIEIQWSDIMALKANYPEDGPGTLDIVLSRQPLFFRETNPQPRKHTLWQATSDFTNGQATMNKKHFLQCPQGLLGKHFEKLVQCDLRLNFLSQQEEMVLESPYFETRISAFDNLNESSLVFDGQRKTLFDLNDDESSSGVQTSPAKEEEHDHASRHTQRFPHDGPSPSSVMDNHAIEEFMGSKAEELKGLFNQDLLKKSGIHPSMSMNDLVNHIENQISEQRSSSSKLSLSAEERQSLEFLEEVSRCLFSDYQCASASEQSIMKRVDSLCCLLQKDPVDSIMTKQPVDTCEEQKQAPKMSRKDSVGELLLNLPRIASLPQFLFNIPEDCQNRAR
ncbi:uncharacterized protein LOC124945152 [Impatiens glandulifera]|uniref:uncharacterized protein LOC124945152 n=1 Tax=Impatiens glandulifera TaxID=253017 RepID=UPI001FB1054D|nr:uncharacterized protein LOC124945152 [Impatiens glandulifera]